MVRRLIPSDGTVSNGSHGSHCISLKAFSISPGPRRKSSDNPLRNKRIPGQKWCKFCAASSENSRLARNGVKTPVLGITVGPGFTKLPDLQLYELRGVFCGRAHNRHTNLRGVHDTGFARLGAPARVALLFCG
jgi:hypothetical protein